MAREHQSQEKLCHSERSVIPQHLDPQTTKKNQNQALPLESSWSRKKTDPDMDSDSSELSVLDRKQSRELEEPRVRHLAQTWSSRKISCRRETCTEYGKLSKCVAEKNGDWRKWSWSSQTRVPT